MNKGNPNKKMRKPNKGRQNTYEANQISGNLYKEKLNKLKTK